MTPEKLFTYVFTKLSNKWKKQQSLNQALSIGLSRRNMFAHFCVRVHSDKWNSKHIFRMHEEKIFRS